MKTTVSIRFGGVPGTRKERAFAPVADAISRGYAGRKIQEAPHAKDTRVEHRCHQVAD
jgi:uncharacterized protein YcfJ